MMAGEKGKNMSLFEFLERLEADPFDPKIEAVIEPVLDRACGPDLSEMGFSDFRREIKRAAGKSAERFYFSQSLEAYYADYRPTYPERSAADFTVSLCFGSAVPRLTMRQETATIPTVKQYLTMAGLLFDLARMEAQA